MEAESLGFSEVMVTGGNQPSGGEGEGGVGGGWGKRRSGRR